MVRRKTLERKDQQQGWRNPGSYKPVAPDTPRIGLAERLTVAAPSSETKFDVLKTEVHGFLHLVFHRQFALQSWIPQNSSLRGWNGRGEARKPLSPRPCRPEGGEQRALLAPGGTRADACAGMGLVTAVFVTPGKW